MLVESAAALCNDELTGFIPRIIKRRRPGGRLESLRMKTTLFFLTEGF